MLQQRHCKEKKMSERREKNWENNVNTFSFHSKGERLCGLLSEKTDYESLQQQFAHEQQQQRGSKKSKSV